MIRAVILRDLRVEKGVRTLDLGCGPGTFSDIFAQEDYWGADINLRYIEYARQAHRGNFVVCDARNVNLPDGQFDQVLVFALLHHLPDSDVRQVLREVKRLLAPGGRVLLIEDIPAASRLNLIGHLLHKMEQGRYIRPVEEYRRLYSGAGRILSEETLRSGVCDYYLAVLTTS
jgi:ubiquinone/menaquinone biosynthesis C-methylase UbiE